MSLKHINPELARYDSKTEHYQVAVAPYNFVRLPERMVTARTPIDHDSYHPDAFSGSIACTWETCAPTYIRGMLTDTDFAAFGEKKADQLTKEEKETKSAFFSTGEMRIEGQPVPRIPGSSLRGMVRSLVEIVSYGRMRYVTPKPTFTFRAVAASKDDPLRDPYQAVIGQFSRNVRAGYLKQAFHKQTGEEVWFIQPAQTPSGLNLSERSGFLKVKERNIKGNAISNFVRFDSPNYQPNWYPVSFDVENKRGKHGNYAAVTDIADRGRYRVSGVLVCSGNMKETKKRLSRQETKKEQKSSRKNHTLILAEDSRARRLTIDKRAIEDYLDGLTVFQKEELGAWSNDDRGVLKHNAPVFYVPQGNQVRYFGHSPNFRIPADLASAGEQRAANPLDFVPLELRNRSEPDLAEAIFGWVEDENDDKEVGLKGQRAGRVSFGDATFVRSAGKVWYRDESIIPRTLASPKPTTFQHYLVQQHPDDKSRLRHYGSPLNRTEIRGHKLYWHRGEKPDIEATAKERDRDRQTQLTRIRPINPNVTFNSTIHFENLRSEELGALLWALMLPDGAGKTYRHKIGMGKPLGMGGLETSIALHLTNRTQRYETLFTDDGAWDTGAEAANTDQFITAFEHYLLVENGLGVKTKRLADLSRIKQLLTMLEWREGTDDWLDKTRYMEIERDNPQDSQNSINEYKERPVLPDPLGVVNGKIASRYPKASRSRGKQSPRQQTTSKPKRQPKIQTPSRPARPTPQTRQTTPRPQPPRRQAPSTPQGLAVCSIVKGKVIDIRANGVYIALSKTTTLGRITTDNLHGKRYQYGADVTCVVLAIVEEHGEKIADCAPAKATWISGTVIEFSDDSKQGIVQPDLNTELRILISRRGLSRDVTRLKADQRVEFKLNRKGNNIEARNVRPLRS